MYRQLVFLAVIIGFLSPNIFIPRKSAAQMMDSITSEHVRLRLPVEREALGRDIILDLERCYAYMSGATDATLPRKILVIVDWNRSDTSYSYRQASISIGMNQPAAAADSRAFLLYQAAREIAHLGLLELSRGAEREDNRFVRGNDRDSGSRIYTQPRRPGGCMGYIRTSR